MKKGSRKLRMEPVLRSRAEVLEMKRALQGYIDDRTSEYERSDKDGVLWASPSAKKQFAKRIREYARRSNDEAS